MQCGEGLVAELDNGATGGRPCVGVNNAVVIVW